MADHDADHVLLDGLDRRITGNPEMAALLHPDETDAVFRQFDRLLHGKEGDRMAHAVVAVDDGGIPLLLHHPDCGVCR